MLALITGLHSSKFVFNLEGVSNPMVSPGVIRL